MPVSDAIPGNSLLIGELLANLADNAIRYNRAGGMVLVRTVVDATAARVEVEDTGPGIPDAHLTLSSSAFIGFPWRTGLRAAVSGWPS
jgi:two-component system, OmpR family, sensor histidine kinase TctE